MNVIAIIPRTMKIGQNKTKIVYVRSALVKVLKLETITKGDGLTR